MWTNESEAPNSAPQNMIAISLAWKISKKSLVETVISHLGEFNGMHLGIQWGTAQECMMILQGKEVNVSM